MIYQPTRVIVAHDDGEPEEIFAWGDRISRSILRDRGFKQKTMATQDFLRHDHDGVIVGGPGWGKTTFLRHIYRTEIQKEDVLPVLITLRRPTAVEDLERFVEACTSIQKNQRKAYTLLLVDGYDEVSKEQRLRVSEAILRYQTLRTGKFYLTCREYYELPQFNAPEVRLGAFTRDDQVRFVEVFLSRFAKVKMNAEVVVQELEDRGFEEFLEHPLLLTLACIVRTSATSVQPRSTLRLLQRALDVLCFQWDEQKNIDRQSSTPLDGRDRVTILKNIALTVKSTYVLRPRAEEITRKQLTLMGMDKVDPQQALLEIARFYGILVPAEDGYEFVHRTLHDYLAAQQWVESGEFAKQEKFEWNSRTAYAACLIPDCTQVLKDALAAPDGLPSITEIIANHASFQMRQIAEALIDYFSIPGRVVVHERRTHDEASSKYSPRINGRLDSDFIRLANTRFLDFVVEHCCDKPSPSADLLVTYAAVELFKRREKLMHQTYDKALQAYKTDTFTFAIVGGSQTQLQFLNPVLQNRLKVTPAPPHK